MKNNNNGILVPYFTLVGNKVTLENVDDCGEYVP